MPAFQNSKRVSIYLSTDSEVGTINILKRMFQEGKEVFVPTYAGREMIMLKLYDFDDYEKLPLTKWNIKQPNADDVHRENPMLTDPLDLILVPGVAFTTDGGRLGHGMGYYDKYLHKYFNKFADRMKINKTLIIGLGFKEQLVSADQLPLDALDYPLNAVLTSD